MENLHEKSEELQCIIKIAFVSFKIESCLSVGHYQGPDMDYVEHNFKRSREKNI